MSKKFTIPLLALLFLGSLAPAARADSFGVTFGKKTKHGSITVGYSTGPSFGSRYKVHHAPRFWVPGHYETRCEKIWIEPRYEWRHDACGRAFLACVAPGHFVTREVKVFVPGHWQDACH